MPTRREALFNILSAPFSAVLMGHPCGPVSAQPEIIPEPHCLSEESANGFRLLVARNRLASHALSPKVIIVPGARQLSRETGRELLRHAVSGAWLILESGLCFVAPQHAVEQIRVLRNVFGLDVHAPLASRGSYIEYVWPLRRLVRDFGMITPVGCSSAERIAEFAGTPVCAQRRVGKGRIIFLGSMLGPGLLAEEREAHDVGAAILDRIRNPAIDPESL